MSSTDPVIQESSEADRRRSRVTTAESRRIRLAKRRFYFLTISGGIRFLELFLSVLHVGSFAFFGTFYVEVSKEVPPPLFMATIRETFFMLINLNTLLTTFYIIVTNTMSYKSRQALSESLFLFLFDFMQFLMILAASIGLNTLYHEKRAMKVYEQSLQMRRSLGVTGLVLGCLHLLGSFYDLIHYIRRTEYRDILPP